MTFNNRAFVNNGVGRNLTQQTPSFSETTYPRPTAPMTFAPNPNRVLVTTSKVTDDISLNRLEVRVVSLSQSFLLTHAGVSGVLPATSRFQAGTTKPNSERRVLRPSHGLAFNLYPALLGSTTAVRPPHTIPLF